MYYTTIVVMAFIVALYVGCKTLLHKRYYRDVIWYICMLTWAFVITIAYNQNWFIASQLTSVAVFDECFKPFARLIRPIMSRGYD